MEGINVFKDIVHSVLDALHGRIQSFQFILKGLNNDYIYDQKKDHYIAYTVLSTENRSNT